MKRGKNTNGHEPFSKDVQHLLAIPESGGMPDPRDLPTTRAVERRLREAGRYSRTEAKRIASEYSKKLKSYKRNFEMNKTARKIEKKTLNLVHRLETETVNGELADKLHEVYTALQNRVEEIKDLPDEKYNSAISDELQACVTGVQALHPHYDYWSQPEGSNKPDLRPRAKDRVARIDSVGTGGAAGTVFARIHDESNQGRQRQRFEVVSGAYALKRPGDVKNYAALFGKDAPKANAWADKQQGFFHSAFSASRDGITNPALQQTIQNAMTEGLPSGGGFLVPGETSDLIHTVSLENEIITPRCFVQPMRRDEITIPAMEIGNHSTSLYGGFTATYTPEAGTMTDNNPKARAMELKSKKMTGFLRISRELFDDVDNFEAQVIQICGKGLAWYRDYFFLNGTGAGEPQGILNSPCLIVVAKEAGQAADCVVYENLMNMEARMYPAGLTNAVWICHQTLWTQLRAMEFAVGTGGTMVKALERKGDQFYLLDRPCYFTEKLNPLGDQGDIVLADLSQYVVGLRMGMQIDMSKHVYFTTDELAARLIERHDGQSLWNEALTLKDGSTTVSPFVTLAER